MPLSPIPQLSPNDQFKALKAACELPPWLQRIVFGAPPIVGGQELAMEMHIVLRLAGKYGWKSLTEGHTPEKAREVNRTRAAALAGPPLPMARAEALTLSLPTRSIPARIYVGPGAPPPPRPLIVFFHGGGWTIGDLDTHDGVCRFLATHSGAAVLSVGYRLAPEHRFPAAVEDAVECFRWAVDKAAGLEADPARIAIAGDSAGGNLAAVACLLARTEGGPMPAMQALLYPVTDLVGSYPSRATFASGFLLTQTDVSWCEGHYLPPGVDRSDPRLSVLLAPDHTGLPPAYVATAGFDPLRDEGQAYAEKLKRAEVPVVQRRQSGLIHGFANMTSVSSAARTAMLELCGAIRMGLN